MTSTRKRLHEKIQELEHLLGKDESARDFKEPTLLKDVPSFTSHETIHDPGAGDIAQLEGRS